MVGSKFSRIPWGGVISERGSSVLLSPGALTGTGSFYVKIALDREVMIHSKRTLETPLKIHSRTYKKPT